MQVEIFLRGPSFALGKALERLGDLLPNSRIAVTGRECLEVLLCENDDEAFSRRLMAVSGLLDALEEECAVTFDLRMRRLFHSEPSGSEFQSKDRFSPVPSISIEPWSPSTAKTETPHVIIIDPCQAFGTGMHPTTRLCLEALSIVQKEASGFGKWSVLDFGCGTGLLSIAALKMGAGTATGIDIDHDSVEAAKRNVELNRLSEQITIREGSWDALDETYELIVSNLAPSVMLRAGNKVITHLKKPGTMIVSGIGAGHLEEMRGFFRNLGLSVDRSLVLESWAALIMRSAANAE
ncbi:MAG: 50S ribosomal protein L11 methyltransferase [Pseudomonadota bacterium]